jgi:integral membrane protein
MTNSDHLQFFTDQEAWNVFRLAAFGEAFGWSLLITGVLWRQFGLINNHSVLQIAGQLHGTLFLAYFIGLLAVYKSLHLSRKQLIVAAAVSVPPYGTLVFEKWLAHKRRLQTQKAQRHVIVRAIILHKNQLLVAQPKKGTSWCLPGGAVAADESSEAALVRLTTEQTSVAPVIKGLRYIYEYRDRSGEYMELFFAIQNGTDFKNVDLQKTPAGMLTFDELQFAKVTELPDLQPAFLQAELTSKKTHLGVKLIRT